MLYRLAMDLKELIERFGAAHIARETGISASLLYKVVSKERRITAGLLKRLKASYGAAFDPRLHVDDLLDGAAD